MIRIYIADNINNNILNGGQLLDTFGDESIIVTSKQTDVKDISKNYPDFTQPFDIPATPRNNVALKFWYDDKNIGQFENANLIPARIDINGVLYRVGTVKINTAKIIRGEVVSYNIEFTTGLKSLKERMGENKLSDMTYPITDFAWSDSNVYNYITNTPNSDIEVPLISLERLWDNFDDFRHTTGLTGVGIRNSELRPAVKNKVIFEAIEKLCDVKFAGEFYESDELEKSYIWLNRNDAITTTARSIQLLGTQTGTPANITIDDTHHYFTYERTHENQFFIEMSFRMTPSSVVNTPYKLFIQEVILNPDGSINEALTSEQENEGFVASHEEYRTDYYAMNTLFYKRNVALMPLGTKRHYRYLIEVKGTLVVQSYKIIFNTQSFLNGNLGERRLTTLTPAPITPTISVTNELPEMTVYNYFNSFCKMYNLVITPILDPIELINYGDKEVIELIRYNKFYTPNNRLVDITEYVNSEEVTVNKIDTYKGIEFKHADTQYGTNLLFKKAQSDEREFGSFSIELTNTDEGEYKVESNFNIMKWREFPHHYSSTEQVSGLTYSVKDTFVIADAMDENFTKAIVNKPTIFYSNGISSTFGDGMKLSYCYENNSTAAIAKYNIFSNVDGVVESEYTNSLLFSNDTELRITTMKNLYSNNYQNVIEYCFSPFARKYFFKANLPTHLVTTLRINDRILIQNKVYQIDEMSCDITRGKAELKLLNTVYV